MKSEKTKNTIIRVPLSQGDYATISNRILHNEKLTSEAKVLLQILLNNTKDWDINLEYYSNKFGWCKEKQASIINNLKQNGFLSVKKYSKGKANGFDYVYMISEYGNLVNKEEVLKDTQSKALQETTEPIATPEQANKQDEPVEEIDIEFVTELQDILDSNFDGMDLDKEYTNKVVNHYLDEIDSGRLSRANFDPSKINEALWKSVVKHRLEMIEKYIDKRVSSGTAHERKCIKQRALDWFQEKFKQGEKIDDRAMGNKVISIQASIIGANRHYASDYSSD